MSVVIDINSRPVLAVKQLERFIFLNIFFKGTSSTKTTLAFLPVTSVTCYSLAFSFLNAFR